MPIPHVLRAFLALIACASPSLAQVHADKILRYSTPHYDLWIEGDHQEAQELGEVLEQAWTTFDGFFHAHPVAAKRMKVKLLGNEQAFLECAWSDGAVVPAQCRPAYWAESTGVVYAFGKPSSYSTRRVLIFGAALQFHTLLESKNQHLQTEWYEAGLAQAFSRHTWDGKTLRLLARPRVEIVDFPKRALALIQDDPSGLPKSLDADLPEPVLCWSIAGLCLEGARGRYRSAFEKYALGTTGSRIPAADFLRTLGKPADVAKNLRAWLIDSQTPFECASEEWEDRGETGLVGSARFGWLGFCILKDAQVDTIECTLGELPKLRGRAGLVTGYYDLQDLTLISVVAPTLKIETWRLGKLVNSQPIDIPGDKVMERKIKLVRKGPLALIEIDGVALPPLELPKGRNGFFVEGCRVAFKNPRWE